MEIAEFLFDVGTWMIAIGVTGFMYIALLWLLSWFFKGVHK